MSKYNNQMYFYMHSLSQRFQRVNESNTGGVKWYPLALLVQTIQKCLPLSKEFCEIYTCCAESTSWCSQFRTFLLTNNLYIIYYLIRTFCANKDGRFLYLQSKSVTSICIANGYLFAYTSRQSSLVFLVHFCSI